MKKNIILCLLILCCLSGCMTVKDQVTIHYGEELTYSNEKLTKYAELEWSSSDETVATVNKGKIKALTPGNAVITAVSAEKTAAEINVTVDLVPVKSIVLSTNQAEIKEEEEKTLTYSLFPENASDYGMKWKSADESIATVNEEGVITGIAPGQTSITISTPDGLIETCKVTVIEKRIHVQSITLSTNQIEITEKEKKKLSYTIYPENASGYHLKWKSSDPDIASIDNEGTVTAKKPGQTTISISTDEGINALCSVTVKKAKVNLWTRFGDYDDSTTFKTITVSKDGSWMSIDTNPRDIEDFSGYRGTFGNIELFLDFLDFSGAVYESMGRTTAMQGKQQAESECCVATWTYHPDKGLEVLISVK